ncbi:hypothetical protein D3C86_1927610 [compost metagenome]
MTLLISLLASKNGTNTKPRGGLLRPRVSMRARISPRRLISFTSLPRRAFKALASSGCMYTSASGTALYNSSTRWVMVPVCQCSRTRPVLSQNGYSASGISAGGS